MYRTEYEQPIKFRHGRNDGIKKVIFDNNQLRQSTTSAVYLALPHPGRLTGINDYAAVILGKGDGDLELYFASPEVAVRKATYEQGVLTLPDNDFLPRYKLDQLLADPDSVLAVTLAQPFAPETQIPEDYPDHIRVYGFRTEIPNESLILTIENEVRVSAYHLSNIRSKLVVTLIRQMDTSRRNGQDLSTLLVAEQYQEGWRWMDHWEENGLPNLLVQGNG